MTIRLPYRWELLGWLWLAYLFNQADRQAFSIVLPLIKADLRLSDVEVGLVASMLTLALAVTIPFAGYAGDILSRKRIVVYSLLAWSAATLVTGFGNGLIWLILVRSLATGVGEAFYAPSAFALIGQHHQETRGRAMAIHQTSLYVGVVGSGLVAGWLGQHYGWRAAFWAFGGAGIFLAGALGMRLRDTIPPTKEERPKLGVVAGTLVRTPTVAFLSIGLSALVFVNVGYLTWMPAQLHERFGLSLVEAGFASMFYHHVTAFCGVLLGGWLSDRVARRRASGRMELQAAALLAGAPFLYWLGSNSSLAGSLAALAGFGFFRGVFDSNTYAALFEVVQSRLHASATALVTAFAFLTGSLAPVALGAVKQTVGLSSGLSWLAVVYVCGGMSMVLGAIFTFPGDHSRAMELSPSGGQLVSSGR